MKALAPSNLSSSQSVKRKITSLRSGGPDLRARNVSNNAATPAPSSLAPNACAFES